MSKKHSTIICAVYCAVVLTLSGLLFLLPKDDFSPRENRMLAKMPQLTAETVIDGRFTDNFSEFCADRFPFRTSMLTLNSSFELGLGKLETKSVMKGANGNLIKRLEYNNFEKIEENLSAIKSICDRATEKGMDAVFFCAPRAVDVLSNYCPPLFDSEKSGEVWAHIDTAKTLNEKLRQKAAAGEYVFYRTDHHWTSLGAYYAYCGLGEELGFSPYSLSDFTPKVASENFYGTTYSSALLPNVSPDKITAYRYAGDNKIKVTDMSTGKTSTLYDFTALEGSSKYDFFLGGNKAHLRVESGKPRLILIKDSFANSVVPFLARHYDIDVIDPRYLREQLDDLLETLYSSEKKPDMLILFGIDTLNGNIGI